MAAVRQVAIRQSPCRWLERDAEGRPRCEHGWAHKTGVRWSCPSKASERRKRYRETDLGRASMARWNRSEKRSEASARWNRTDHARSIKQIHELTRVRV